VSLHVETKMPLFIMFVIIVALFLLALDIPRSVHGSSPPFSLYCPHTPFRQARMADSIVVSTIAMETISIETIFCSSVPNA
jgi:hypothetical protein